MSKSVWLVSPDASLKDRFNDKFNIDVREYLTGSPVDAPQAIIYDPDTRELSKAIQELEFLNVSYPKVPKMILSNQRSRETVFDLIKCGVSGYVLKTDSTERVGDSLSELISGGAPFNSAIAGMVIVPLVRYLPQTNDFNLKDREIELLQLMSEGLTKKDISQKYGRSVHTIDNHVRQIYLKMRVNNLGEAVGAGFRAGLLI